MKHQWVIRISALAAVIAAGVVFARWEPPDRSRFGQGRSRGMVSEEATALGMARSRLRAARYDEAIERAREALKDERVDRSLALRVLGDAHWRRDAPGDREEAIAALREVDEIETRASSRYRFATDFYRLGMIRARIGEAESAREAFARGAALQRAFIENLEEGERVRSKWLYDLACYEALAGEREAALASWERAVEEGYDNLPHAMVDPDLFSIRDEPRFIEAGNRVIERMEAAQRREPNQ